MNYITTTSIGNSSSALLSMIKIKDQIFALGYFTGSMALRGVVLKTDTTALFLACLTSDLRDINYIFKIVEYAGIVVLPFAFLVGGINPNNITETSGFYITLYYPPAFKVLSPDGSQSQNYIEEYAQISLTLSSLETVLSTIVILRNINSSLYPPYNLFVPSVSSSSVVSSSLLISSSSTGPMVIKNYGTIDAGYIIYGANFVTIDKATHTYACGLNVSSPTQVRIYSISSFSTTSNLKLSLRKENLEETSSIDLTFSNDVIPVGIAASPFHVYYLIQSEGYFTLYRRSADLNTLDPTSIQFSSDYISPLTQIYLTISQTYAWVILRYNQKVTINGTTTTYSSPGFIVVILEEMTVIDIIAVHGGIIDNYMTMNTATDFLFLGVAYSSTVIVDSTTISSNGNLAGLGLIIFPGMTKSLDKK